MISEMNSFLIHREKTITEIYRENTLKELIDEIIARLQEIKKLDFKVVDKSNIEVNLLFLYHTLEENSVFTE